MDITKETEMNEATRRDIATREVLVRIARATIEHSKDPVKVEAARRHLATLTQR